MFEDETLGCVRCDKCVPVRSMLWLDYVLICEECFEETAEAPLKTYRTLS